MIILFAITHFYSGENEMAKADDHVSLAPTVLQVLEQFATAMRADTDIDEQAIARLEKIILKETISCRMPAMYREPSQCKKLFNVTVL